MPKKGINDLITEKTMKLDQNIIKKTEEILKGTKPFASKELDPDMFLWAVNNIGYQDLAELRQEFGDEAVGKLKYEAVKLEAKRG